MLLLILHLMLTTRLLNRSNCKVEDLDLSHEDRFYVAAARVPSFFTPNPCVAVDKAHIDVYETPSTSKKTAEIRWGSVEGYCTSLVYEPGASCPRGRLRFMQYSDEENAFVVVERSGRWVRVRLDRGTGGSNGSGTKLDTGWATGWIHLSQGDEVIDYYDLVAHWAEMTGAWDGHLSSRPDGRWRAIAPVEHQYVTVIDSQRAHGKLWFKVRLLAASPYDVRDPRVIATGWIRAYSDTRQPTVVASGD